MTTGSIFLLPNGTFFVELVIFVVLVVIISKKIIPPINKALAERHERVRASLDAADQARADAVAADDERRAVFDRIVGGAEADVAVARQRAVEDAANRLGEIAMDVVARVIGRPVSAEAHRDLITEAVSALQADATGGAAASSGAGQ